MRTDLSETVFAHTSVLTRDRLAGRFAKERWVEFCLLSRKGFDADHADQRQGGINRSEVYRLGA